MKVGDYLTYFGETNMRYTKHREYILKNIEVHKGDYLTFKYIEICDDTGSAQWHSYNDIRFFPFDYVKTNRRKKLKKLNESRR